MHKAADINHAKIAKEVIWKSVGKSANFALTTHRIDDDDIISSDFLTQIEELFTPEFNGCRISLARGIAAIYEEGKFYFVKDVFKPFISIGQPLVELFNSHGDPLPKKFLDPHPQKYYLGGHTTEATKRPVIVDGTQPSWIWTQTAGQDSRLTSRADLAARLQDYDATDGTSFGKFGIDSKLFRLDLPPSLA